jgi:hypothetical protein
VESPNSNVYHQKKKENNNRADLKLNFFLEKGLTSRPVLIIFDPATLLSSPLLRSGLIGPLGPLLSASHLSAGLINLQRPFFLPNFPGGARRGEATWERNLMGGGPPSSVV